VSHQPVTSTTASLTDRTQQETDMTVPTAPQPFTQTYLVTGMTCGHCVTSVTEELQELPGVDDVNVDLVAGGTSTVTVTSEQPLDDGAVQGAVEEAGYQLA
jgi:copper chaperone